MRLFLSIIILTSFLSCHVKETTPNAWLVKTDSLRSLVYASYLESKPKDNFLTFLNNNGAYSLALEIAEDSIKYNYKIELANIGYQIALQHGYYNEALHFLENIKCNNKADSINHIFKYLAVYLKEMDTVKESECLSKLMPLKDEIPKNDRLKFELLSDFGAHYHNLRNYKKSLELNTGVYQMAHTLKVSELDIALSCQRLANDYNDQLRNNLIPQSQRIPIYKKAKSLYTESIALLAKIIPTPRERLAESYMTLNMLDLTVNYTNDSFANYRKALELILPQFKDPEIHNYYFCYHPILASIILTQMAEVNFDRYFIQHAPQKATNSLRWSEICSKLLQQSVLEPNDYGIAFDMLKTFRTRNTNQYISYLLFISPKMENLPVKLLEISTQDKYPILTKNHLINADNSGENISKLKLVNHIRSLQFLTYCLNSKTLKRHSKELLTTAAQIEQDFEKQMPKIDSGSIAKLRQKLGATNTLLINYQCSEGILVRIAISKDSVSFISKPLLQIFKEPFFGNALINHEESNNVSEYRNLAGAAYDYFLSDIPNLFKYSKIIIASDKLLPQTFDGLVLNKSNKHTWSDLEYLGDKICTYYVPNIQWLFRSGESKDFKINYTVAHPKHQNKLPYSDLLTNYLKEKYSAEITSADDFEKSKGKSYRILHLATHTASDSQGYYSLLLDSSRISALNSYAPKCNLAILNACETIKGRYLMTEGTISLARLFLSSCADATISSTLKVDNNASAELFKYFYQFLYNGNTVSESLYKAKKELRKRTPEWSNPYYWSSYQLMGKDMIFTH